MGTGLQQDCLLSSTLFYRTKHYFIWELNNQREIEKKIKVRTGTQSVGSVDGTQSIYRTQTHWKTIGIHKTIKNRYE